MQRTRPTPRWMRCAVLGTLAFGGCGQPVAEPPGEAAAAPDTEGDVVIAVPEGAACAREATLVHLTAHAVLEGLAGSIMQGPVRDVGGREGRTIMDPCVALGRFTAVSATPDLPDWAMRVARVCADPAGDASGAVAHAKDRRERLALELAAIFAAEPPMSGLALTAQSMELLRGVAKHLESDACANEEEPLCGIARRYVGAFVACETP